MSNEQSIRERFWSKVDKSGECWIWTAAIRNGYGAFSITSGHSVIAHRFSWEASGKTIPEGLVLDHLCRNRACVNPDHLEPVSHWENIRRGISFSAKNARKTHCKNGHEFTVENTIPTKNRFGTGRRCRVCNREIQNRYWQKRRRLASAKGDQS